MNRLNTNRVIKPCPFCGKAQPYLSTEMEEIEPAWLAVKLFSVCCRRCEAKSGRRRTVDGAVNAWNRRAAE